MTANRIDLEVFHNLMVGISEHLSAAVERTAFTSFVKETHDYGVSICTPDGTFFTFPRQSGVTSFVGLDVGEAIAQFEDFSEGDVVFTNDPYNSGALCSHLPDLHMFRPVFADGQLICFTWGFIHSSDFGGAVPGSIAPTSYEVFQEGLRVPPMKLYRKGELQSDIKRIIQANVRIPTHVWGDLEALLAGFRVAEREILRLVDRFGREAFVSMTNEIIEYAEAKSRRVISTIPDGSYEFTDYLEDDYVADVPVRVKLKIEKLGSDIHLDYNGTDPQVMASVNIPTGGKRHAWLTVPFVHFLLSEDPTIPVNGGLVRPISVNVPSGTLVNPEFPAASGARIATGIKILEVTLGALGMAVPERVPAAGSGQGMVIVLGTPDLESGRPRVNVVQPMIGGSGGRPTDDGFDGSDYTFAFLRNTPIEVLEKENPIRIHEYGFRYDSGGAGEFRGGMGMVLEFESLTPHARITARGMERTKFSPWGVQGGRHGMSTAPFEVKRSNGIIERIQKVDVLHLSRGDRVRVATSGAGGYGDPYERDLEHLQLDVDLGFVSREEAQSAYGAVFDDPGSRVIHREYSQQERSSRRKAGPAGVAHSFGEMRVEFERRWPPELHDELLRRLDGVPVLMRGTLKNWIIENALQRIAKGPVGLQTLDECWDDCQRIFWGSKTNAVID